MAIFIQKFGRLHIEAYHQYCLVKKGVSEGFPFDNKTLVFKVMGKVFALTDVDEFQSVNLKCDPERAIEFRADYNGINPGFHMNKKHWNTVDMNKDVPDELVFELIDHSYDLVVKSLTKKLQASLASL